MRTHISGALAVLAATAACISAAVVGTNPGAQSITAERIAALPKKQQGAWKAYLDRSIRQRAADRAALLAELKAEGLAKPLVPPNGFSGRSMSLRNPPEWYGSAPARRAADGIVSFQTPAGGWGKNLNVADHVRRKGESYVANNLSRYLSPGDFDTPQDPEWEYVGTLDNDSTTTEMQFLARVIAAVDEKEGEAYRASFLRGFEYLLAAQFPNGGWPQVWPLEGSYHDAITFNDGAVTNAIELLEAVAQGKAPFAFVPAPLRKRAKASVARGLQCILAAQIIDSGQRAVWGQQHDAFTLRPVGGRNYEPPALCSGESADLMKFLMELPKPGTEVVKAVDAAAAWFQKTAIHDKTYQRGPQGARLVDGKAGTLIWARYYEIGTDRPIFGDRDKSIHDDVSELSRERANGYSWYNSLPQEALKEYAEWKAKHR